MADAATTNGLGFGLASEIQPFATFINGVAKYVATPAPLDRQWADATVVDGDLVEFVRGLKDRPRFGPFDGAATYAKLLALRRSLSVVRRDHRHLDQRLHALESV